MGYFTLGDASTNQVAASGLLRIQVYTSMGLNLKSPSSSSVAEGLKVKNILYDNTFAIGATNFHWETFGSILTVRDLACHFAIPHTEFKTPVHRGKVVAVQLEFCPDGNSHLLGTTRHVLWY